MATAERSFSKLKLINTYLRNIMQDDRLSGLAVLSIENAEARNLMSAKLLTILQVERRGEESCEFDVSKLTSNISWSPSILSVDGLKRTPCLMQKQQLALRRCTPIFSLGLVCHASSIQIKVKTSRANSLKKCVDSQELSLIHISEPTRPY